MYNKKVYAKLGLKVPTTWDAVHQQQPEDQGCRHHPGSAVLRRHLDQPAVRARRLRERQPSRPEVGRRSTRRTRRKYANPARRWPASRTRPQIHSWDCINNDYASLTNVNALKELATGQAAQYPMITAVIGNVLQSTRARSTTSATSRCRRPTPATRRRPSGRPNGTYIPKSTTGDKLDAAEKFVAFTQLAGRLRDPERSGHCRRTVRDQPPARCRATRPPLSLTS